MAKRVVKKLSNDQRRDLLRTLELRFSNNLRRHKDVEWKKVLAKLEAQEDKILALYEMEQTGGEPDVVGFEKKSGEFLFYDCSPESPAGRRSVCYDHEGLISRKEARPANSAVEMASSMGITLLTEEEYRSLQSLGSFDLKTSSWLQTPAEVRSHGGAIFGDLRYSRVFVYHNGAQSYYAARGFRGVLRV